jgi:hypothetical protein
MPFEVVFIVYAGLYWTFVSVVGALSIYLGYRLFLAAYDHDRRRERARQKEGAATGTEADVQLGTMKLTLRNAAPGTCFALFGAALVVTMVTNGRPSFRLRQMATGEKRILMRGADDSPGRRASYFKEELETAARHRREGRPDQALGSYMRALSDPEMPLADAAKPLNEMAWILHKQEAPEALPLAAVAVALDFRKEEAIDTLARIASARGAPVFARSLVEEALKRHPNSSVLLQTQQDLGAATDETPGAR